jgi:Amt family ammonium transporter
MKFAVIAPGNHNWFFLQSVSDYFICFICLFTLFIYSSMPCSLHPTGILAHFGVKDFAGGTVVHMSVGFAALLVLLF